MNTKHRARAPQTVAVLILAAGCASLAAWAFVARATRAQTGEGAAPRAPESRSAIYGRVVNEATGKPLRRAHILLMMLDGSRVDRDALTDARGEFRIGQLPAGHYVVWAEASGMLTPWSFLPLLPYGVAGPDPEVMRRHFEVVELDGKADREVTVRARRGGAITGRVTYADGDPAADLPVLLLDRDGSLTTFSVPSGMGRPGGLRTDDRGVYRVAGLPPGEYLVAVTERANHAGRTVEDEGPQLMNADRMDEFPGRHLLQTFHPSASSVKAAKVIVVGAGEEHADVDVTIPDRELRTLTGVVRAARGGRPIKGASVSISTKADDGAADPFSGLGGGQTKADAEGRWQLREVPDGLYTLDVSPPVEYEPRGGGGPGNTNSAPRNLNAPLDTNESHPLPPRRRQSFAPISRDLRVSGDVAELVVELGEGGRISGTFVVEGGKKIPYLRVYAVPISETFTPGASVEVPDPQADGNAFELEGLIPGRYLLRVYDYAQAGNTYLKAITWQGKDLMREPLEVGEGTRVEGVRVVFGGDPAVLRVRVSGAGGRPAFNTNVFLLPADLSRWSLSLSQQFCTTGDEGFCFINAPPGDYLVVPAPAFDQRKDLEKELRRRALNAPRVTLRAKEEKTLETVIKE
jgi:Carboxypeptidase regulatory-like domain